MYIYCRKMFVCILILSEFILVQTYNHQQPVAQKVWSESCVKNTYVLNDCNWCWCTASRQFQCKARVCEEVDMFGHFKDTIQEIDVGMEGHGSWRSTPTSCSPGFQYRRGSVHCVCDEDGNWPNPVCRDLFRVLHSVEVTEKVEESISQSCSPTKLYLVACNACFCPYTGILDPAFCTNRTCTDNDPVLAPKKTEKINSLRKSLDPLEVYAPCIANKIYIFGSQQCRCLRNNRLVCDDEAATTKTPKTKGKPTLCSGNIGNVLKIDCNLCKCESEEEMYCTTRKCMPKYNKYNNILKKVPILSGRKVNAPIDDEECVPGTTFLRNCNKCYCMEENGKKIFGCLIEPCKVSPFEDMARDCTTGTTYEIDCLICQCNILNGYKYENCIINTQCISSLILKEHRSPSLDSLHGYCEPLHTYTNGCNTCRCLANGKIVKCTTRLCVARSSEPVAVDIVPLQQEEKEPCPEGYSYKIGCNMCFCLSNGNALCTTADCSKNEEEL